MFNKDVKIAIIGLGYVGLPLAVEFAKKYQVIGFDINKERVKRLKEGVDETLEVDDVNLQSVLCTEKKEKGLIVTDIIKEIADSNFYIITVPTPTDKYNKPVLTPLIKASETVGMVINDGDVVVYESTVYPGATEEDCIPVLERTSGKTLNKDFYAGYSPERINPGDKLHTVTKIKKVTSGSTPEIGKYIDKIYQEVIDAGTFLASSIKVAEASKVIENSQRDINIAFVNELAKIFNLLDIDTNEVLEAASTKWNFLPFKPGLVGGHCIGVDPFYLAQKAQEVGYHPEIILAGRRLNDSMGAYIAQNTIKLMIQNDITVKNSNILVLGITFKENCPDIRNSRVIDIIKELETYNTKIDVYDPWADTNEVKEEYGIELINKFDSINKSYDAIIAAVAHYEFLEINLNNLKNDNAVIFDVKAFLPKDMINDRL